MKFTLLSIVIVLLSFAMFSCGGSSEKETVNIEADSILLMDEAVITPETVGAGTTMEVLRTNGSFNTLVQAIEAAGLTDTFTSQNTLTLFAPTDEAFESLPAGRVDELLKPENREGLKAILTYHVAEGRIMSDDMADGMVINTLNGQELTIHLMDNMIMASEVTIVSPDLPSNNGVIHAVNNVIIPPITSNTSAKK